MIKPIGDRFLVKLVEVETIRKSGIFIPEIAREKPNKGTVICRGNGIFFPNGQLKKLTVKVGDIVLFHKNVGTIVVIDDEEYTILREDDIYGIEVEGKLA